MKRKVNAVLMSLLIWRMTLPATVSAAVKATPDNTELALGINAFLEEFNVIITGVVAFGVMTGVLAFVYLLTKLAAVGDQPKERAEVLKELAMVGVTTSLLGAFAFIVSFYYAVMIMG